MSLLRVALTALLPGPLLLAVLTLPIPAGADAPTLPAPLPPLTFGMLPKEVAADLQGATAPSPPISFGDLQAHLVVPEIEIFGSVFRLYLQFDQEQHLRQALLERRHADATPASAADAFTALKELFGEPAEICLPRTAKPAAGRVSWRSGALAIHLIGFDDLGLGILTRDPELRGPGRSRDEVFRSRQQRSLPRRLLIRIHPLADEALAPPPCPQP